MRFLAFVISIAILGYLFTWIYSLVLGPLLMLVGVIGTKFKEGPPTTVTFVTLMVIAAPIQLFMIFWWDAYVATRTLLVVNSTTVVYKWPYIIYGFIASFTPIGYMVSKEARMDQPAGDPGSGKTLGGCLFALAALLGFTVFFFFPPVMFSTYGWFLDWWFKR